jgi:hypothetical protein
MTIEASGQARGTHNDRLVIFKDLLAQLPVGRLLDLATGHGGFAVIASELGWDVTAVDARTERVPMTPGINWIQADIREFPTDGYDVITVLGLLYHLEVEAQAGLLQRCHSTMTILDTHVSLRPTTMLEGYMGHFYDEDQRDARSSWGNPRSFWATEESLYRMILSSGYATILRVQPAPVTADRHFHVLSPLSGDELQGLVEGFNRTSAHYRLEPKFSGVAAASVDDRLYDTMTEMSRLREERDAAVSDLKRLRSRKSVKLALNAAKTARPVYQVFRGKPSD